MHLLYIYKCVCVYIYTYIYVHIYIYACHVHACICVYKWGIYTWPVYAHTLIYSVWLWREEEDKDSLNPFPCRKEKKTTCINKIWEQKVLTKARMFVFLKWKISHRTDYLQIPTFYHKQDFNDSPSSICLHGGISTDTGCHGNLKQLVWACSLG